MNQHYWAPEQVDRLRKLHAKGLTDGKIAKMIGRSKNAVLGKRHQICLTANGLKPTGIPVQTGRVKCCERVGGELCENIATAGRAFCLNHGGGR